MLTPNQIRAARALLGWSARELSVRAGVHVATVQRMERGQGHVRGNVESLRKVERALEAAGIEFLAGSAGLGVRLKRPAEAGTGAKEP